MPHTRSAKKQQRKNFKRRAHNRAAIKTIKNEIKKVLELARENKIDELRKELKVVTKKLDKAASRRIVHPNMAARKKSQLARLVNQKSKAAT